MKEDQDTSPDIIRSRELNRRCDEWTKRQVEYANNGVYRPRWEPYVFYGLGSLIAMIVIATIVGLLTGNISP